ncbi:M48 family metallopeptidase [Bacillus sp. 1P06AnD]|uniref:M48 family metallopeptidase n=1 Tax=Bacillus sp. 1P06AnD TaxID=3132208 RepID=UPI00399F5087
MEENVRAQLVHRKETFYFILASIVGIITYLFFFFSIIGVIIFAVFMMFPLLAHALNMAHIKRNAVKISEDQFPEIYEKALCLAKEMGISNLPDMYVIGSDGILNAFAARFFGKNMIVVYSEIFDLIDDNREDEVMFIIAHELAHIKRGHLLKHMLILPAMWVPLFGEAYLRACEYTCDRYAAYYTGNLLASQNALMTLAVGKKLQSRVDKAAYIKQLQAEKGFFLWLSEKISTHPHLPKRMNAIAHWQNPVEVALIKEKRQRMYGFFTSMAIVLCTAALLYFLMVKIPGTVMHWAEEATSWLDDSFLDDHATGLMIAAYENDVDLMKTELENGADANETDSVGATALHYSIGNGSKEAAVLLLERGSDINLKDEAGYTPLHDAALYELPDMVTLLLKYGADKLAVNGDNQTPYELAKELNNKELSSLLKP